VKFEVRNSKSETSVRRTPAATRRTPLSRFGAAFTLIEILLAVTVFSIVMVAINTVFYSALRLRNKTAEAFDRALPLQRALAVMKRDLANIVAPGGTFSGTLQSTILGTAPSLSSSTSSSGTSSSSTSQTSSSGTPVTAIPIPGAAESSPFFYTSTGALEDTTPWADIQQVSYVLMPPTNGLAAGKDLVRCVTRNLLPVTTPDPPEQERLLGSVQDIFFLFYDGLQWQNVWDSTQTTNTLPQAIKVLIQLLPDEGQQLAPPPVQLVVPLYVQGRTNQATQTSGGGL